MADRMWVNQEIQIGVESTPGTAVACSKQLLPWIWKDQIEAEIKDFRGTGRKYPNVQEEEKEWMTWDVSGPADFNAVIYPASSFFGIIAPVAHGASTTAKDWKFAPPIAALASPQTYTIQHGSTTRGHEATFLMFSDFGYKISRGGGTYDFTTKGFSQAIIDPFTMTATPTIVATSPPVPKQVNIYLDTTSAGLGVTQIAIPMTFEYSGAGMFQPFWSLNRTNASFAGYADLAPKCTGKIKVEADANGMALLAYIQSQTTYYMRVDTMGPAIDVPNSINAETQHDMAVKFTKPGPFEDEQGLMAIEWGFTVVEDPVWGFAQKFTVTNLLTAL